ncbi:hypothetical protein CRG98_012231 [Punica granatum]|uniref:Uncharacterized protein n=1 Tax=Punica granatum TaxID=22663 RepID=A0A2I0KFS1_PUNGR|nr:hypothetical protein CRG98_012231 [Punica granatum]
MTSVHGRKYLLLAPVTVARAMAGTAELKGWIDAEKDLKSRASKSPDMEKRVHANLEYSYDDSEHGLKKNKILVRERLELFRSEELKKWKDVERISLWRVTMHKRLIELEPVDSLDLYQFCSPNRLGLEAEGTGHGSRGQMMAAHYLLKEWSLSVAGRSKYWQDMSVAGQLIHLSYRKSSYRALQDEEFEIPEGIKK